MIRAVDQTRSHHRRGFLPAGLHSLRLFAGPHLSQAGHRHQGSGNIGATNVARTGSKGLAIATLLLDAAEGMPGGAVRPLASCARVLKACGSTSFTMPITTKLTAAASSCWRLAALCAILGHMFTPWLGFKGGKGVATAVGAFGARAARHAGLTGALCHRGGDHALRFAGQHRGGGGISLALVWWLNPCARTSCHLL